MVGLWLAVARRSVQGRRRRVGARLALEDQA